MATYQPNVMDYPQRALAASRHSRYSEVTMNNASATAFSTTSPIITMPLTTKDIWFYLSWTLTLARVPLLLATLTLMLNHTHPVEIVILITAIAVADILDGEVFRLSSSNAEASSRTTRHIVDAVGDRFVIHTVLLVAFIDYGLPLFIYGTILAREVLLTVTVLLPLVRDHIVVATDFYSKLATICIAFIAIGAITSMLPQIAPYVAFVPLSLVGINRYLTAYRPC